MKPYLFISARPEVEAVGPEYESVRRAMGLDAGRLEHIRLDVDPLARDFSIESYAGVVVGGSPYNVTTPEDAKYHDAAARRGRPRAPRRGRDRT